MGKAIVTFNRGGGLYRIRPLYDTAPLDAELNELKARQSEYSALLYKTLNTIDLLRKDVSDATNAKNAVIRQWRDEVISKTNPVPPVIPPPIANDPETGLPWVDPDRAQEAPLLDLVNGIRTAASLPALTRDADLDTAALTHLRYQAATKRIGHFGAYQSKPADRVLQEGYNAVSVIEVLSYGTWSPDSTLSEWQKDPETVADLLAATATAAGVAYKYAPLHPHTHLWCLLIVEPGAGPPGGGPVEFPPDPAKEAAEQQEQGLERIEAPHTDKDIPPKLGEAVQKYAIAVNKRNEAEKQLDRLMAEKLERDRRIAELEKLKSDLNTDEIEAFCCTYSTEIPDGAEVATYEIPGFYDDAGVSRAVEIYGVTTFFTERPINIGPFGGAYEPAGQLRHGENCRPELVFYNAAIEPGHLRWRPAWRYGTITALNRAGNVCNITLSPVTARMFAEEPPPEFSLFDAGSALVNVPISYPPCHGAAFEVGDDVLIMYEGRDRTKPKVIGFRRSPRSCEGRQSWLQV